MGDTPIEFKKHEGGLTELGIALAALKDNMKEQIEYVIIMAELRRVSYTALIAQGFTETEALELCKNPSGG